MSYRDVIIKAHMCELHEQGGDDLIESLSDRPLVVCKNCGAKANSLRNVCAVSFTERVARESRKAADRKGAGRPADTTDRSPLAPPASGKRLQSRHR